MKEKDLKEKIEQAPALEKDYRKNPEEVKNEHFGATIIGVPTFGMQSADFLLNLNTQAMPIFNNVGYMFVQGKPVDVARNEIAQAALNNKHSYVFFRDDDVLAPRDALGKLMKRLPMEERTDPGNRGKTVVGGIVYSKQYPPIPMIHRDGCLAGYEDWQPNDLIECDAMGMGCTLIPTNVLKLAMPHLRGFHCVSLDCQVNWSGVPYTHERAITQKMGIEIVYDEPGQCPHCGGVLVSMWFRTIRDWNEDGTPTVCTEDAYFLEKCRKAEVKIYADAGVICEHHQFNPDPRENVYFSYYPSIGPGWRKGDMTVFYPSAGSEVHEKMALKPRPNGKKNSKIRFNLGSGGVNKKGFISVDLNPPCDFVCNVTDISPLIRHYGQADEILASHILEHMGRNQLIGVIRNWLKGVKKGGTLNIEVPDGLWAAKAFYETVTNGKSQEHKELAEAIVMGRQSFPLDEHRSLMYEDRLKQIMKACKNQVAKYTIRTVRPKGYNQQVIRLKAVKK
jgi:predicted SAM-dependent methyltransferase